MPVAQRPLFALMLRLMAAVMLATLYALVKLANHAGLVLPEIMFWRQAITLPLLAGWLLATGRLWQLRTSRIGAHVTRSMMGTVGMVAMFGSNILLPLAVSTILGFTTPMFAVILSALWLREAIGKWRWLAVALGFAGVLLIARPGGMVVSPLGAFAGLMSGFMVAVISIQIRDMGRTETPVSVVFYFALFGAIVTAPILPFVYHHHSLATWGLIAALGVVGTMGQLLLTAALRYGAVSSVIVMDYSALIWTTLYGWKLFGQLPPASLWAGAPLIIAAGLVIAWRETRAARARAFVAETKGAA